MNGSVWCGTDPWFEPRPFWRRFEAYERRPNWPSEFIDGIAPNGNGLVWVWHKRPGARYPVDLYRIHDGKVPKIDPVIQADMTLPGNKETLLSSIVAVEDGFWVCYENVFVHWTTAGSTPRPDHTLTCKTDYVYQAKATEDGTLWIASANGLFQITHGVIRNVSAGLPPGALRAITLETSGSEVYLDRNGPWLRLPPRRKGDSA